VKFACRGLIGLLALSAAALGYAFRVGLSDPQEWGRTARRFDTKRCCAGIWRARMGTKAKPLAAYRWRLCCLCVATSGAGNTSSAIRACLTRISAPISKMQSCEIERGSCAVLTRDRRKRYAGLGGASVSVTQGRSNLCPYRFTTLAILSPGLSGVA
jgi:hypothetical protein